MTRLMLGPNESLIEDFGNSTTAYNSCSLVNCKLKTLVEPSPKIVWTLWPHERQVRDDGLAGGDPLIVDKFVNCVDVHSSDPKIMVGTIPRCTRRVTAALLC